MSDFAVKLEQARGKLPLRRLMEQYGFSAEGKTFKACPFCGKKGGAGFFAGRGSGTELFKCHHNTCPSGTQNDAGAWDEVGFLMYQLKLPDRKAACVELMRMAGVWTDREPYAPSVMPGKGARRRPLPAGGEESPKDERPADVIEAAADDEDRGVEGQNTMSEEEPEGETPSEAPEMGALPNEELPGMPPPVENVIGFPGGGEPMERSGGPDGEEPPNDPPDAGGGARPLDGAPAMRALRFFYSQLVLTDADRKKLWENRGLTARTSEIAGIKSNRRENEQILRDMLEDKSEVRSQKVEGKEKEELPKFKPGARLVIDGQEHDLPAPPSAAEEAKPAGKFPLAVLLEAGLWTRDDEKPDQAPKPNAQFYGYGLLKRGKEKDKRGRRKDEWGWTFPPIIPYFDASGDVIFLRPHKGGPKGMGNRFFVARQSAAVNRAARIIRQPDQGNPEMAVIGESEFKALAVWQAFDYRIAVGGVPGIQSARPLFGDIEDWLELAFHGATGARPVIIGFDNEEKGIEKLPDGRDHPSYKPDKFNRYEAQIWARWLAVEISKEGYEGRVCILPDKWKDPLGKADWDGALARIIKEESRKPGSTPHPPPLSPGEAERVAPKMEEELSNVIWERVKGVVRDKFMAALQAAARVHELWEFFDGEAERIIQNGLLRISYDPMLPIGGREEETIARRLHRYARKMRRDERFEAKEYKSAIGFLINLAKRYQQLGGGYYRRKRVSDTTFQKWSDILGQLNEGDAELKRACELVIDKDRGGLPERVTNFFIKWHYEILRPDGKRDRLVTLESIDKRTTKMLALPSEMFATPSKFREWLLNAGGFSWMCGEKELQWLHTDSGRYLARLEVEGVPVRCWYEEGKAWFYGDVAYLADGREVKPDDRGIFWLENIGYKLWDRDQEGEEFIQGTPRMRPEAVYKRKSEVRSPKSEVMEVDNLRELFRELLENTYNTLGGHNGYFTVGLILASFAGPELFKKENAVPILWLHGPAYQGKGTIVRWLLNLCGYTDLKGVAIGGTGTTSAGVSIAMQQYGCSPLWLDEYQPNSPDWVDDKIKSTFDRSHISKKTLDSKRRKILAMALVSGVATSADIQMRSRCIHVPVAKAVRIEKEYGQSKAWFAANAKDLFFLGRHILRHRLEFVRLFLNCHDDWLAQPELRTANDRAAVTYGAAYAAILAMVGLLSSHAPEELAAYKKAAMSQCIQQEKEAARRVDTTKFLSDVVAAQESRDLFETDAHMREVMMVRENPHPRWKPDDYMAATAADKSWTQWKHYLLYLRPTTLLNIMRQYYRNHQIEMPLNQDDLLAQFKTLEAWVPWPKGGEHRQRFQGEKHGKICWCLDVDYLPIGRLEVDAAEWGQSLRRETPMGMIWSASTDWEDPRKGDAFGLIDKLLPKAREEE